MLTEISRGNPVYYAHTRSARIMLIHLKDGTYLQITFMKYDQYCPQILGVDARNILFHIFFRKVERKGTLHRKSTPACMITQRSPFPNMKLIHEYLPLLYLFCGGWLLKFIRNGFSPLRSLKVKSSSTSEFAIQDFLLVSNSNQESLKWFVRY